MATRRTDEEIHRDLHARIDSADADINSTLANVMCEVWEEESRANSEEAYTIIECRQILRDDVETYNMTRRAWHAGKYKTLRNQWALYHHAQTMLKRVQELARAFTSRIEKDLHKLANGYVTFDSWQPPDDTPPEYAAFFKQLNVPCITGELDLPNLLIHQLGSYVAQEDVEQRVKGIFSQGFIGVCNASGSGKTRTLLEGLTLHWGFYFTMAKGYKGVGSADWTNALNYLLAAPGFRSHVDPAAKIGENFQKAYLDRNHKIVGMRVDAVLLARLEIFREFLKQLPKAFTPADEVVFRTRWLMLQLDPKILPGFRDVDVFARLSDDILDTCQATVDPDALAAMVKSSLSEILDGSPSGSKRADSRLRPGSTVLEGPFHIVMDEVQAVASRYREAFRSAHKRDTLTHELLPRPLFRAILMNMMDRAQKRQSVWVIPTGTNVSQTDFEDSVASAGQQGNCKAQPVRYTGGLTTIDALEAYTRRYLPQEYLNSSSGSRLLQRILTWLPGRYRFTAQFIFFLLGNGLRSPHRLLNSFVFAYTNGYVPTDAEDLIAQEPEYPLEGIRASVCHVDLIDIRTFDGDIEKRLRILKVVRPMIHSYLLRAAADMVVSSDHSPLLVEVGFGRYASLAQLTNKSMHDKQPQEAEINEPLMILRLATHLETDVQCTAYDYFARQIGVSHYRTNSNGWENYLAHCLLQIFSSKPMLSDVFKIVNEQTSDFAELMSCRAEFVGVVRANGTHVVGPVRDGRRPNQHNPPAYQPSVTLGVSTASTNNDTDGKEPNKRNYKRTLDWLKTTPTPFLFPDTNMGPDLIAILRLDNKELCWLLLQAKLLTPEYRVERDVYVVKGESVKDGIWSVTPECLYLSRHTHQRKQAQTEASLRNNAEALAALKKLPNRTALAGEYSALRAVAIFPGVSRLAAYAEQADPCKASPLVELDFDRFRATFKQIEPTRIIDMLEMGRQGFAREEHKSKEKRKQKRERAMSAQHNRSHIAEHPSMQTGQKVDPAPKGYVKPRKYKIAGASSKAPGSGRGRAPSVVPRSPDDGDAMEEFYIAGDDGPDLYSDFPLHDQDPGTDVGLPDRDTVASGETGQSSYGSFLLGAAGQSHQPYPSYSDASASVVGFPHSSMTPPALHHHPYSDSSVAGPSTLVIPSSTEYSHASSGSVRTPKRMAEQIDSSPYDDARPYDDTGSPWKKPKVIP